MAKNTNTLVGTVLWFEVELGKLKNADGTANAEAQEFKGATCNVVVRREPAELCAPPRPSPPN